MSDYSIANQAAPVLDFRVVQLDVDVIHYALWDGHFICFAMEALGLDFFLLLFCLKFILYFMSLFNG